MKGFNILDFLDKKRKNLPSSREEIFNFIDLVAKDQLPKYQISAFLMAVAINGLTDEEITWLTLAIAESGKVYEIPNKGAKVLVDKHSSGGIGDKTSLIILPILVAAGLNIAKLSGRGLGFTGGTIDKLESIGVKTNLEFNRALELLDENGIFIISQTSDIAPVDKVLYALRDVTSTVSSIPLIASSIMSKKMSFPVDYLFLDIKYGSGAFCKTLDYAKQLAKIIDSIGKLSGLNIQIFISSMQQPLGGAVGNAIEVLESQKFLAGEKCSSDLDKFMVTLTSHILVRTGLFEDLKKAEGRVREILKNGEALAVCEKWFGSQGADIESYKNRTYFNPKYSVDVLARGEGYFSVLDNERVGIISNKLGSGRMKAEDEIDFHAGIWVHRKINDYIKEGDVLYTLYSSKEIPQSLYEEILENTSLNSDEIEINELVIPYV